MAGTAQLGGVVACLGDDHTGESSTVLHHSEFALVDAMMPILSPGRRAGGARLRPPRLGAVALHRLLGRAEMRQGHHRGHRGRRRRPAPAEDRRRRPTSPCRRTALNIRLHDTPVAQEARLHDYKRFAAEAFARANRIDRRVWGDARRADRHRLLRQVLARHPARARPARPRRRRGGAARHHHLQGRHGLAARHGELPRVGARPRAHHRRRGEAQARRGADQGGDLRRPPRPPGDRLEERAGRRRSSRSSRRSTRSRSPAPSATCSPSRASRPRR